MLEISNNGSIPFFFVMLHLLLESADANEVMIFLFMTLDSLSVSLAFDQLFDHFLDIKIFFHLLVR